MFSRPFLSSGYRISSKSNLTKITWHRTLHSACQNLKKNIIVCTEQKYKLQTPLLTATFIRHQSASTLETQNAATAAVSSVKNSVENSAATEEIINFHNAVENIISQSKDVPGVENLIAQIPELPTPIESEIVEVLVGEPSFTSLGLGGYTPWGLIQYFLEWLHVTGGLPWWATIVLTTVIARTLMFPIVIKMQRYFATMNNLQPKIQGLQMDLADARKMGDHMEVARLTHELYSYMKEKGADPMKNALLPMAQAPVFISFFWALRGMVHVPVDSMKTGGMYWFMDLTVPDPYYILPLLTSATLLVTIYAGTDFMKLESMGSMKYIMKAAPFIMFPFIINFEGGILCYWVSTNIYSLVQSTFLRMPKVRTSLNIPVMIKHDMKTLPQSRKKFVQGFKDSWENMKVARELNARSQYDEIVFEKAGRGPVPKTYKYNPTLQAKQLQNTIFSKKRDT